MADEQRMADNHALSNVASAYTLSVMDTVVQVEIPLAAADDYDIILPPVGAAPGTKLYMEFHRADGIYVDGAVTVKGAGDEAGTSYASLPVSDDGAFLVLENLAGRRWVGAAYGLTPPVATADTPKDVTAAVTLGVAETCVHVTIPAASANNYEVTLPPVAEANGRIYSFEFARAAAYVDGSVSVTSQDDDLGLYEDASITKDGGFLVLLNVAGARWIKLDGDLGA